MTPGPHSSSHSLTATILDSPYSPQAPYTTPPLILNRELLAKEYFRLLSSIYGSNSTILISPSSGKRGVPFLGKADGWPSNPKLGYSSLPPLQGLCCYPLSLIWSKRVPRSWTAWFQISALLPSGLHEYVFSGPQCPYLYNGSSNSTYFVMLLRGIEINDFL